MERVDLRPVDACIIAVVIGVGNLVYTHLVVEIWARFLCIGATTAAAAFVLSQSLCTARWLSRYHTTHYDAKKDSLVRPQRKAGNDIPCPYPDAWYCVVFSEELKPGTVKDVVVCNQNLIVFRPELKPGEKAWPAPAVLDAYCSHLGAHLALGGGRVEGDCVRCPFHGWCFDGQGKLTSTSSGDCPAGSDIRAWPVMEKNGVVAVWMSSSLHTRPDVLRQTIRPPFSKLLEQEATGGEGGKQGEPSVPKTPAELTDVLNKSTVIPGNSPWFSIPLMAPLHSPCLGVTPAPMAYHGCTENLVNSVLWENPENGADVAHLNALHNEFILPSLTPFLSHRWAATWEVRAAQPTLCDIQVKEEMVLCKYAVLPGEVNVHITQCGPSQVFIDMTTPVGHIIVIETVSPISPREQRVQHAVYAAPWVPRMIAKVILYSVMAQYEKDVPIWCNKVYAPRPQLAKHDPAIGAYRRWRQRFMQPGAITYAQAVRAHQADQLGLPADSPLDW